MLTSIIDQCLVVSLPGESKRKEHIKTHFKSRGISQYHFVDGVLADSEEVADFYRKGFVKAYTSCFRCGEVTCECANNIIIPQQVGNWLAFINVWKKVAVSSGWTLVCEDDVYFYEGGLEALSEKLADLLPNFADAPTLLRLAQSGLATDLLITEKLTLNRSPCMSNAAYIMNNQYAQILLNSFEQITTTSDIWVHREIPDREPCRALTVSPLIATDLSFNKQYAKFPSAIHPKGLDEADEQRAKAHIQRATDLADYLDILKIWLKTEDVLSFYQSALFKELAIKQTTLIAEKPPNQPNRSYSGQLDTAINIEYGYASTFESQMSVDRSGNPIPWITYSAMHYLKSLDLSQCNVFEWGSGNSSLYFGEQARRVVSVESNADWYVYAASNKRENVTTKLLDVEQYCRAIEEEHNNFELIIIDGDIYRRAECAQYAVDKLAAGGLIVLDNSDWLPNTAKLLRERGFTQIDFSGPGPINAYLWCTSLFFRGFIGISHKSGLPRPGALDTGIKNERDAPIILQGGDREEAKVKILNASYQLLKTQLLPANVDVFAAQEGEDALLRRLLKKYYYQTGFYVDVGAHHPTRFSTTYHYYLKGWRGINIDPVPGMMELFDEQRPGDINLELGIANTTGSLTYTEFEEPAFNTFEPQNVAYAATRTQIIGERQIDVRPLVDILDDYLVNDTKITFLSVDVEGFELSVLRSSNWEKYRPMFVVVEALAEAALHEITSYLISVNYVKVASTKNSFFFCDRAIWRELM